MHYAQAAKAYCLRVVLIISHLYNLVLHPLPPRVQKEFCHRVAMGRSALKENEKAYVAITIAHGTIKAQELRQFFMISRH